MTVIHHPSLRFGERDIPVVLPNRRDPRLHLAAVIISVHIIGMTALGFEVSVPQILAAIATAGLIDVSLTLAREGRLVWPASGMLTGSGVALILRYVTTGSGDYWSWEGWYWFALVAGVSVLSKYVLRWRDSHIFNPSNLGLVVVFVVVSSSVLEPLDFWWAPLDFWMLLAYAVIFVGGVLITRRLRLFEMAVVFWLVLVAGLGVLAASGHCMIATWSTSPVCGEGFWKTLATSPEILIFLFFMITDPKTIPKGRTARVAFAASLGMFATLMIAPHTLEYGAKVGLLSSLVIWSPLRDVFDRVFPAVSVDHSGVMSLRGRLNRPVSPAGSFGRGFAVGSILVVLVVGVVLAGSPARQPALARSQPEQTVSVNIDPSTLPTVRVDASVEQLNIQLNDEVAGQLALTLAENLALEGEAIRYADVSRLALADGGERLDEIQARIEDAIAEGARPVDHYQFESLNLRVAAETEGQTSAALAFDATGTVDQVIHGPSGMELERSSRRFRATFVMRLLGGERWSIVRAIES